MRSPTLAVIWNTTGGAHPVIPSTPRSKCAKALRGPLVLRSAFAHFDRGVEGITGCAPPVVFHIPARVGDRMILRLETRVGANYLFRIDVTANLNGFWTQGGNGESGREIDFL